MYKCIDIYKQDILFVEDYEIRKKLNDTPKDIRCIFCNKRVFAKAENSVKLTHFSHYPYESCSCIDFKKIFNMKESPKKSKEELNTLKQQVILNSYKIFKQISELASIDVDYTEFTSLLEELVQSKALELIGTTAALTPYLCLHLREKKDNCFFIFTTYENANSPLWVISKEKNVLKKFQLDSSNHILKTDILPITYDFIEDPIKVPSDFLNNTINELLNIFNISYPQDELLIKALLNEVI